MEKRLSKISLTLMILSICSFVLTIFMSNRYYWLFEYRIFGSLIFITIPISIVIYFFISHIVEYAKKSNCRVCKLLNFIFAIVYFVLIILRYIFFFNGINIYELFVLLMVIAIGVLSLILFIKVKPSKDKKVDRKDALIRLQELKMLYDKEILTEEEYNERRIKYIDYI